MRNSKFAIFGAAVLFAIFFFPPAAWSACLEDAVNLLDEGRPGESIEVLNACNSSAIGDYILYYRAKALLTAGKSSAATEVIASLIKRYPRFPMKDEMRRLQVDALLASGHPREAANVLDRKVLKRRGENRFDDLILLADALRRAGSIHESRRAVLKAVHSVMSEEQWDLCQERMKKYGVRLTRSIAESAVESLFRHGRWSDAGRHAKVYLRRWPSSLDLKFILAKVDYRAGDLASAERRFRELRKVSEGGSKISATYWLAQTYAKQDEFEKAIAIRKALHRRSHGRRRWRLREQIAALYGDAGRYDEAIHHWKQLLGVRGRGAWRYRGRAMWEIGWALYQKNDFQNAVREWKKLKAHRSEISAVGEGRINYWTARAHEMSGRKPKAILIYKETMNAGSDYYSWLSLWRVRGMDLSDVPWPNTSRLKCRLPSSLPEKRWRMLFGVDEALGKELLYSNTDSAAKLAYEKGLSEISYRLGRRLLVDELNYPPRKPSECLAWKSIYVRPYAGVIKEITDDKLPPAVVWAVMMSESAFRADAESLVGARGLMQLMPDTAANIAASLGVKGRLNLFDPNVNIPLGVAYLRELVGQLPLPLAIASYNAGERSVKRWMRRREGWEFDRFIEEIPYSETQKYVKKVMARAWNYSRMK